MIYIGRKINLTAAALVWYGIVDDFFNSRRFGAKRWGYKSVMDKQYHNFETYYDKLLAKGKDTLKLLCGSKPVSYSAVVGYYYDVLNYYRSNLKTITLADEQEMISYNKELESKYGASPAIKNVVKCAVNKNFKEMYGDFEKTYRDEVYSFLINHLNLRTCPYCNRNYTFTMPSRNEEETPTRPELDHFYNESEYSYLVLSFFNLVPCCHICNHVKGIRKIGINPYFNSFDAKFIVRKQDDSIPDKDELLNLKVDDMKIGFDKTTAEENENIKAFAIERLYAMHRENAEDIFSKAIAYESDACQAMVSTFQGAGHSPQSVHDFVWGRYLNEAEYGNKPLSKFTEDILDEIGIKCHGR